MRTVPGPDGDQIIADPGEHLVLTGPIRGEVTTEDGTTYDVNGVATAVDPKHAEEVAHLVGLRYAAEGHPNHDPGHPFVYEPPKEFASYTAHKNNRTLKAKV